MVMVYEGSALKHLARVGTAGLANGGSHDGAERPGGQGAARATDNDARRQAGGGEAERDTEQTGQPPSITCGFCGQEFVEDRTQATCQACPLSKACGLMRCPHCGYENAKEPGWITKIKEWIG